MPVKKETPVPYYSFVRYLAGVDRPDQSWFTPQTVAEHIQTWVDLGYELFSTEYAGAVLDEKGMRAAEGMVYTFKYVG